MKLLAATLKIDIHDKTPQMSIIAPCMLLIHQEFGIDQV